MQENHSDRPNHRLRRWPAALVLVVSAAILWLAANTSSTWATPLQNPDGQTTVPGTIPGACPQTQKYEIENTPVSYSGAWDTAAGEPGDSNGQLSLSTEIGATASFTFTGVSLDLIVRTEPLGGQATVLIDGSLGPLVVDFYSPAQQYQVVRPVIEGLADATHTVDIEVASNPLFPTRRRVYLDAYLVGEPALGPADAFEPDNTVLEATPVTFGMVMTGRKLDWNADQDWISFDVQAGEVFTITTFNLAPGTDTVLTLYDTDGATQLAKSDDVNWPSDLSSQIVYTATQAGTYFAMVAPYPNTGSCTTSYDLSLVKKWILYLPIILKNYSPSAATATATATPTATATATSTTGPPSTATNTPTATPSPTNTHTPTTSPPGTATHTPTATSTPTPVPPTGCAPIVLGTVAIGNQPRGVVVDTTSPSRNRVYVANYGSDSISVINTADNSLVTTITGISSPTGIAFDPDQSVLWVTNYDADTVTPIQVSAGDAFVAGTAIDVGDGPWGIEVVNGAVYVPNRLDDTLTVINATTTATMTLTGSFDEPAHVAAHPITNKVYVTNFGDSSVTVISGGGTSASVLDISRSQPYGVAVDLKRNLIYVATVDSNSIVAIDGATDTYLGYATFQRGWDPNRPVPLRVLAFNPNFALSDGGHLWATTATGDGSEQDQALLIPKGWSSGWHYPIARDVGPNPREGIDIDLNTNRVYVTSEGDNTLSVFGDGEEFCLLPFSLSGDQIVSVLFKPTD
jgi:YVTN family beta-propeller protein